MITYGHFRYDPVTETLSGPPWYLQERGYVLINALTQNEDTTMGLYLLLATFDTVKALLMRLEADYQIALPTHTTCIPAPERIRL